MLLSVKGLTHYFGGLRAVNDFNMEIEKGIIQGLIGPNGAGKTTTFNLITGMHVPTSGEIIFSGDNITGKPAYHIAGKGIARTFQNLKLFSRLTVRENIRVVQNKQGKDAAAEEERLIKLFELEKYAEYRSCDLPYGAQRRLEIARALAIKPKLLLLDEPAAGMNPSEVDNLSELINMIIKEFDITILLIEHQMRMVMKLCHKLTVLNFGEVIATGAPRDILNNSGVVEAYLGKGGASIRGKRSER
ncbi:branched-chain amino acid transport ATP-binding protein LivG [Desulfocucumis palustris]|uniref:Branched-chain amino acid transport ATP-binding protein LivG n=1 Tax=Desulfocucumis palustris TaxID=1898651 RepID=A0A2L2XHV4_9FIRM|nr:ABC transporter ATP-binding protein [Desulfocucumis palustris]GBF35283.1 branched-chain amino acid transport ATP-binding protein LivG [Desulfocucumis palustris]